MFFSPLAGDFSIIVIAAVFGAMVALSSEDKSYTRWEGLMFLFRATATSSAFSSVAALYASHLLGDHLDTNVPTTAVFIPIAFGLAWMGDYWKVWRTKLAERIGGRIEK